VEADANKLSICLELQADSFTHGTSEQRMKWFIKGFKSGDIKQHDTFAEEL
jgi:predicted metalloprotease